MIATPHNGRETMTERLDRIETNINEIWKVIRENQLQMSELRSSVSTLANIVGIHDQQIER
jgi:pyruvate/2-oxoglutarate dehydrogenase complex dihydrolipoamide acyltransferase (E2) component